MEHKLVELEYEYNALEPYFDEETMKIHHSKHHQAYVDKLNLALHDAEELKDKSAEELIKDLDSVSDKVRAAIRNNGGGHVNHSFFWKILKKDTEAVGEIVDEINNVFGSIEKFKEEFKQAALTQFGSGWAWLVLNNGKLEIVKTANQDSPLTDGKMPLIGLDVWEHAYYLKYQNKRPEYVDAFFNVINWKKVNEIFLNAMK